MMRGGPRPSDTTDQQAAALALAGRRWVLRIVWELREGPQGFRPMQVRCGHMSPSVLSDRLSLLRRVGLVEQDSADRSHRLTADGETLLAAVRPLVGWGESADSVRVVAEELVNG